MRVHKQQINKTFNEIELLFSYSIFIISFLFLCIFNFFMYLYKEEIMNYLIRQRTKEIKTNKYLFESKVVEFLI